jgi:uncharacterized membrane protein YkvA (DUF1232 family)
MKGAFRGSIVEWFINLIRNSKYRWIVILGSLLYLVSPLDISPDVFPVLGWIDDGLLASIVVTELTQMVLAQRRKNTTLGAQQKSDDSVDGIIDIESYTIS